MKKSLLILSLFAFFSCSEKQDNFSKYEWIQHYAEYDAEGNLTSKQRVLFKNDSVVCFSELTGKTTRFPLIKKDSLIIFKQLVSKRIIGEINRDTIITDTLLYDFKKILNKPLLITKSLKYEVYDVLTTSKNNLEIEESNNFLSIINFKIGGFQIGDSISIQNFENIESYKTYENTNLLVGNPKGNENIEVEIIDKKYIYKITQKNIVRNEIENIIKVINDKIKIEPDTIKKSKPRYREGFRWESNGIIIRLLKRDMYQYYTDRAEKITKSDFRSQILKSTMFNLATKQLGNDKYYELEYENELFKTILKNTGNKTIQSSIIE
jgi:hypothetical protein